MKIFFVSSFLQLYSIILFSQAVLKPFPHHTTYAKGTIKPDVPQDQMDNSVTIFYKQCKERYIKDAGQGKYYVFTKGEDFDIRCVSEGQGYGMLITVLMAGFDKTARETYNGLFNYYKAHPSKRSNHLMSWAQDKIEENIPGSSATDGDMDIAYSLLLADAQWGSKGNIDYLGEAKQMISAIASQEINAESFSILKSNAVEFDSDDYYDMRPSDFMPSHLRSFEKISKDSIWQKVIDNTYKLFDELQSRYSPSTGLFPDFIVNLNINASPAKSHYEESTHDGDYDYNACRIPWRIGVDYLLHGDERAKKISDKINTWINTSTRGIPGDISAGYTLRGKAYGKQEEEKYFDAMCFMAPFAVSAMKDASNQEWLDKLWNYMLHFNIDQFDYYNNTIKLICMIIISGNYWEP